MSPTGEERPTRPPPLSPRRPDAFLTLVAAKRGHLRKGGAPDLEAAARAVLHDWNSGAIRYYAEPPAPSGGVTLVSHFADGFDWEAAPTVVETVTAPCPSGLDMPGGSGSGGGWGWGGGADGAGLGSPPRKTATVPVLLIEGCVTIALNAHRGPSSKAVTNTRPRQLEPIATQAASHVARASARLTFLAS